MRKIVLGAIVALVAVSPAMAAKKSKKAPPPAPAKIDSNEASWRLVRDSLPIYLPSWAMPIYMATHGRDRK
jgi:opacity protein-like surface antigen